MRGIFCLIFLLEIFTLIRVSESMKVNVDDVDVKTNAIDKSDENSKSDAKSKEKSTWNLIEKLKEEIKEKESELENAETINKGFERMIQLINIMGQVDTFLTDRTRLVLKKLALLADDLDGKKF